MSHEVWLVDQSLSEGIPVAAFTGEYAEQNAKAWVAARKSEHKWNSWSDFFAYSITTDPKSDEIPVEVVT